MSQPAQLDAYNPVMKTVHWVTALVIITLLIIGWTMTSELMMADLTRTALYAWHKSLGISILFLSLFRIYWRGRRRAPALPAALRPWERTVLWAVHKLLYMLLIFQPLVGWMLYSLSTHKALYFGLFRIPDLPFMSIFQNSGNLPNILEDVHGALAVVLAILVALHIGAALKHHFVSRDNVLLSMAPSALGPFLRMLRGEP